MKKIKVVKRKKALFGADGAVAAGAILLASAANVAAQARQAIATEKSAREQAKAMEASARTNATALEKQSVNNTEMQEKAIETNKQIAEDQRARQQDIQMTLQMLAGQQTTDERSRQNMQAVKYGGRIKATNKPSPLRGRNKEINITDGGSKQLLGITPEGFELYKLKGDTHDESHRLPNGKKATGIGIDLTSRTNKQYNYKKRTGNVDIEAEGGEYALSTPNDILFLSKHNINGFNPKKAINKGMNPIDAFNIQEMSKGMIKRRKKEIGGVSDILNQQLLQGYDTLNGDIATGAITTKMKNGGSAKLNRNKCWSGGDTINAVGAGANIFTNILGGALYGSAAKRAAGILSDAYNRSASITADAYSRMHGISDDFIKDEDFKAAHYMPAIQDSRVSTAREDDLATRRANAQRKAVQRNSMSSAAALNRMNDISQTETDTKIANQQAALEKANQIQQANAERVTQAAAQNAQLDTQSKKDLTGLRLQLLQYNNDIENAKIAGIAEAQTSGIMGGAQAQADAKTSVATNWANALSGIGSTLQGTANTIATNMQQEKLAVMNANVSQKGDYYGEGNGTPAQARNYYEQQKAIAENPNLAKDVREEAAANANKIVAGRTGLGLQKVIVGTKVVDDIKPGNILPDIQTQSTIGGNYIS